MSARYEEGLLPEHDYGNKELARLTHRVAELELIVRRLIRRVSDLEGREAV